MQSLLRMTRKGKVKEIMPKNKKSPAGTSESILSTPKLYPKPRILSNSQEAALQVAILVVVGILITALILFDLQLIYLHGK